MRRAHDGAQLRRLALRPLLGLARAGSYAHNGSGEIAIAFTTAREQTLENSQLNPFFAAAYEARRRPSTTAWWPSGRRCASATAASTRSSRGTCCHPRPPGPYHERHEGLSVELRMRLSAADAHYGGNLVDGAHGLEIFGDIVTELAIHTDGDEGLFAGYERVEFLAPLHAGDFVRARAPSRGWATRAAPWTWSCGRRSPRAPTSATPPPTTWTSRSW
jgi:hypothetical protein